MILLNKSRFWQVGRVLLVQALIFFGIIFIIWGSQKLYSMVDETTFPYGYKLEPEMVAKSESEKGKILLQSITFQMQRELGSSFGWSLNDIVFNRFLLDNRANRQLGVYFASKNLIDHYATVIAKLGNNDQENKYLKSARTNHFAINPQKFWFPSAEGSYKSGLQLLDQYMAGLDSGDSVYNCRPDDIYSAFNLLLGENVMGYALGRLQDSQNLSFHELDNRIYEVQGIALVVRDYVSALYTLYPEVAGKNNEANMERVLEYLDLIANYDPLYITSTVNSGELMISYLLFVRNRLEDIRDSIRI